MFVKTTYVFKENKKRNKKGGKEERKNQHR
jgi:hypothetical protein